MKKCNKIVLFILSLTIFNFFYIGISAAQNDPAVKYAKTITIEDLEKHITLLASDSFRGREVGTEGERIASAYIQEQFRLSGVAPVTQESYFQPFKLVRESWGNIYIKINNKTYNHFDDFVYLGQKEFPEETTTKLLFVGNIDTTAEYKNISLVSFYTQYWSNQVKNAKKIFDPEANFIISTNDKASFNKTSNLMKEHFNQSKVYFPQVPSKNKKDATFLLSKDLASKLFDTKEDHLINISNHNEMNVKSSYKKIKESEISFKVVKNYDTVIVNNVLAFIEGNEKKEDIVVVTAHYDHLGIDGKEVYHGADDNASGVSTVLEIAEAFQLAKKNGIKPARSVLFIAFTGEEKGLFGSNYYTTNPVFPLEQTMAAINIDMVGRTDNLHHDSVDYVYLIGADKISQDLHQLSENVNATYSKMELDYKYNSDSDPNRFYYRSDHYNFARHNIPVIFYFDGIHNDYHKPTDTEDKIDYDLLQKRARLIFHTVWELANREDKLVINDDENP